jgi:hypothetical protein
VAVEAVVVVALVVVVVAEVVVKLVKKDKAIPGYSLRVPGG